AFSCGDCSGSFLEQQNIGDQKSRAHDDKSESAGQETQVAVEETANRERGDEKQAEVRAGKAIRANPAHQNIDPEPERITIDQGRGRKFASRIHPLSIAPPDDSPHHRNEKWK